MGLICFVGAKGDLPQQGVSGYRFTTLRRATPSGMVMRSV